MYKIFFLTLLLAIVSLKSHSQKVFHFEGKDSIVLTFWKEGNGKYKLVADKPGNSTKDTTAISDYSSFKSFVEGEMGSRPDKKILLDSIGNFVHSRDTVQINIWKPYVAQDTPVINNSSNLSNKLPLAKTDGLPSFLRVLFFVIIPVLVVLLGWLIFRKIRKSRQEKISAEATVESAGAEGFESADGVELPARTEKSEGKMKVKLIQDESYKILLNIIGDKINQKLKNKEPKEVASIILGELFGLKGKLEEANTNLSYSDSKVLKLEEDAVRSKGVNNALTAEISKLQAELIDQAAFYKEFNILADSILNRYYTELAVTLERNNDIEKEEAQKLILRNLLTFAFLSASLLKKQIRDSGPLDRMNLDFLKGDHPQPKGVVTENSQQTNTDALAFQIYQLLKENGVKGLDNVFVQGYQIGQ